ncbi:hypothetical protein, partial [Mycobacterium sp. E1319]|uniref:hypothetical protein n=1 Tax=Mycobacterium sp. E1319 TaxID=1834124 RepID=UPI000AFA88AE
MRKQLLAGGLALAALLCSAGSAQADYDPSDPGLEANWPCAALSARRVSSHALMGSSPCLIRR